MDVIKSQQEEFASFRKQVVEPIGKGVDEVNRLGSGLIQSAAGGVNTSAMEKDLEKVNDKWNALKDKVSCARVKCTNRLFEYILDCGVLYLLSRLSDVVHHYTFFKSVLPYSLVLWRSLTRALEIFKIGS